MFGPGGIGPMQLLIVFGIVILIFGTAKVKNLGSDLGGALKGFKKAMSDDPDGKDETFSQRAMRITSSDNSDVELSGTAAREKQG
jgi:sec-independent protein translocase protein TatA